MSSASPGFSIKDARFAFIAVFLLVLGIKLSTLSKPFLGYFASYQIIYAMQAKFFLKENFSDLLIPKAFYLIHGQPAVILLFYPLNAVIAALGTKMLGGGIDFWGRFSNVLFSTLCVFLSYAIFLRHSKDKALSMLSATLFMLFPVPLVLGQCFVNDNIALLFFLAGYYLVLSSNDTLAEQGGCLLCSFSFVLRIHFLFLLPVILHLLWMKNRWSISRLLWRSVLLISLPLLWALFVYYEAPQHASLHTSLLSQAGEGRRLKLDRTFFQAFPFRLAGIVLSPLGLLFTTAGVFLRGRCSEDRVFILWLALGFALSFLLPQKVIDHPFYLLPFLPAAAFFSARTVLWLMSRLGWGRRGLGVVLVIFFLTSFRFAVGPLYADLPRSSVILNAARKVREISKSDDILVVTDTLASGILYYGKRLGWSFDPRTDKGQGGTAQERFQQILKERRAAYYVVGDADPFGQAADFFKWISQKYPLLYEGAGIRIFDLRRG